MNMNLPSVVTPPSICHDCSTHKTFWKENFTLANMKYCGIKNVRKHRDIKDGNKYTTFDTSLNIGSLEKIKITSSEQKYYFGRSGKGLITSLCLKTVRNSD